MEHSQPIVNSHADLQLSKLHLGKTICHPARLVPVQRRRVKPRQHKRTEDCLEEAAVVSFADCSAMSCGRGQCRAPSY